MNELRDLLAGRKTPEDTRPRNRSGNGRKKKISGWGHGKWQTFSSLKAYRLRRNRAQKTASASRAANR